MKNKITNSVLKGTSVILEKSKDYDKFDDFLKMTPQLQRLHFYNGRIDKNMFHYSVYEDVEKICYAKTTIGVYFNKKLYKRRKNDSGLTYDKKTKKVQFWFGGKIDSINVELFLNHFKIDWYKSLPLSLKTILTKTALEKIIHGKITNPRDYVRHYLKHSLKNGKISTELYYHFYVKNQPNYGMNQMYNSPRTLNCFLSIAKEPNNCIKYFMVTKNVNFVILYDVYKQCKILERKVDFTWSSKRMMVEHNKMNEEIMEMELELLENNKIIYNGELYLPPKYNLITTQKELYIEGMKQGHCVYSYWNRIVAGDYFVVSVLDDKDRITVGIRKAYESFFDTDPTLKGVKDIPANRFTVEQAYKKHNKSISEEQRKRIKHWLEMKNVQKFFNNNYKTVVVDVDKNNLLNNLMPQRMNHAINVAGEVFVDIPF